MEEPFDRQTMVLSAAYEGLGQLASGRTQKGLVLFGAGTILGVLSGVTGTLLRLLTFGRLRVGPQRLNPLALAWLGVYLYNLYDAYNIASGAEDEEDLFDYEEYEPQDTPAADGGASTAESGAGTTGATAAGTPAVAAGTGASSAGAQPTLAAVSFDGAGEQAPASSAATAAPGSIETAPGAADAAPAADAAQTAASSAPPSGGALAGRRLALGGELDWDQGVTKAQLMEALGDDEQVRGVFGQYLPSDRVFKSEDEALNLIPTQAWQSAQGREWTGGELPTAEGPTGYLDSAAGRMPPGDQSTPEN